MAATVWPLCYVGLLFSFLVLLRSLHAGAAGVVMLLAMVTVVKMGDTGAYTVGRLFGRHKLAPHLSPGKTIEGAVGGLVFSSFGAWLVLSWIWPRVVGRRGPLDRMAGVRHRGGNCRNAGRFGRVAAEARRGDERFEPLAAGLRRRAGHHRLVVVCRSGRLFLFCVRSIRAVKQPDFEKRPGGAVPLGLCRLCGASVQPGQRGNWQNNRKCNLHKRLWLDPDRELVGPAIYWV